MATVAETLEMAVRCEAASGPDRELDALVHDAFDRPFEMEYWSEADTEPQRNLSKVPRYTASLDAALTLVPEGSTFYVDSGTNELSGGCHACVWSLVNRRMTGGSLDVETPALALCAAALRAAAAKAREVWSS